MYRATAFAVALAALCAPGRAEAQSQRPLRIAIGAVGVNEGAALSGPRHARDALETALAEVLRDTPELRVTDESIAQLVLRGSLVRWERAEQNEIRCEVSLIVADRGGSVRAMLRGRAGARGDGDSDQLAVDALRAAVRGALRPLSSSGRTLAARGGGRLRAALPDQNCALCGRAG